MDLGYFSIYLEWTLYYLPAGSVPLQLGPWAPEALLPIIKALVIQDNFIFFF
jgi:hypothetical protein